MESGVPPAKREKLGGQFEDWMIIEALYFCIVTLATVGYGDLTPTSAGTQIFTIVYILTGFGLLAALLTSVAQQYPRQKAEGGAAKERRKARRERRLSLARPRLVLPCDAGTLFGRKARNSARARPPTQSG
jgi:Ion channel